MDFGHGKQPATLPAEAIRDAANKINVPLATIHGVTQVEAAGRGYDADWRPKILFETHVFHRELHGAQRTRAIDQGLAAPKWGQIPYARSSDGNYRRLKAAMAIDEPAALSSASWGLFQIMGFNWKDAGFDSVEAMAKAHVKGGEAAHLNAFMALVDAWGLTDELQRRDAEGFARKYNGAGFRKNAYDRKLREAWAAWDREELDSPALQAGDDIPIVVREPPPTTAEVMEMQRLLTDSGFSPGKIDGIPGKNTSAAIGVFEAHWNASLPQLEIPVTGTVNQLTHAALMLFSVPR